MPPGGRPRELARDYAWVIERPGLGRVHVEGGSAGGPIGQWLAVDRPDLVRSLVLACTLAHTDGPAAAMLTRWLDLARAGKVSAMARDMVMTGMSPQSRRKYAFLLFLMRFMPPPKNPQRMVRLLEGLAEFDNRSDLARISPAGRWSSAAMPTLTSPELQRAMANAIPQARQVTIRGQNPAYLMEVRDEHALPVLAFFAELERAAGAVQ